MTKAKLLTDVAYFSKKPKDKEYRISDIPGLYMRVQTSGKKSWQYRIKNSDGKWTWRGLGPYPEISVKAARSLVYKYETGEIQFESKNDRLKNEKIEHDKLFGSLLNEWIDTKKNTWEPSTFKKEVQSIEKHILPTFSHRKYEDISSSEWLLFFQTKQREEKIFNRIEKLISYCRNAYELAVFKNKTKYNPLAGINKFLDKKIASNMKHVGLNELPLMLERIRTYKSETISIGLELLILMFPRPGELRQAKWEQFNFEDKVWIRPSDIMKRGIEHAIPLSNQTLQLLERLKQISNRESSYLFPSRDSINKPISNLTFNAALNRLGYFGQQNPHGFRHIASTHLNDHFSDREQVIEAALSHLKNGVKGAYDKGAHLRERVEIMQFWSDLIYELSGPRNFK